MIKIRLFCVAGMLSSALVNKMADSAKLKEIEVDIQALPESKITKALEGTDVVLLGPQIAYKISNVKPKCDEFGIACGVIPMMDFGMMNGEKILNFALNLSKEMKERLEREKLEREKAEKEAAEREKAAREAAEREAAEREVMEREKAEREAVEREIAKKEAAEREKAEREAAEREAEERERVKIEMVIREAAEREESEREIAEKEITGRGAIEREIAEKIGREVILTIDQNEGVYKDMSKSELINYKTDEKEYETIIKNAKELILNAEREVHISTNIDISVFKDEFIEISQRGVTLTVVAFKEYYEDDLPIDKLYTNIDEKNKNKNSIIMIVADDSDALVAERNIRKEEISHVITDNPLLVSIIYKNIINSIYLLKLRDNIAFKLKDM